MDKQLEAEFLKIEKNLLQSLGEKIGEVASNGGGTTEREQLYSLPPDFIIKSCWKSFMTDMGKKVQYGIRHVNGGGVEVDAWRVYSKYGMMLYHLSKGCFPLEALFRVMNDELAQVGQPFNDLELMVHLAAIRKIAPKLPMMPEMQKQANYLYDIFNNRLPKN